jgi:hypothetical protein
MIILLTVISQVGGVIWFIVFFGFLLIRFKTPFLVKLTSFIGVYLLFVLFLVPSLAEQFGRKQLPSDKNGVLIPHNNMYVLLNRSYVTLKLYDELNRVANEINAENPEMKLVYLDGSFPFIDGWSLPPHFRHDDGSKIDLCFAYQKNGKQINHGASFTGYGNYVPHLPGERNQTRECLLKGNYQYDFSKYAAFTKHDQDFDSENTAKIINKLLEIPRARRIFIEPNLKSRMGLKDERIRFAGCWTVRHDDHIHFQLGR